MTTERNLYSFSTGATPNKSHFTYKSKYSVNSSHTQLDPDLQDSLHKLDDAISNNVRVDIDVNTHSNPTDISAGLAPLFEPDRNIFGNTDSFPTLAKDELISNSG